MTLVGVFGLLLGLLAFRVAMIRPTRIRVTVFCVAYLAHVGAAVFYYNLVKDGVADSALYYYDPLRTFDEGFGLNTAFIIYLVQLPKSLFGGTYLDYFFVFQSAGFFGLCLLMRTMEEIYTEVDTPQPVYTYLLLFMPSLHYWTSAIGKDSLFFLGICLSIWAAMQYKQRLIALSGGMLLMLAVRPHIAVIAAGAFAMAVMVDRRTRLIVKVPLLLLSLAGAAFAAASVWSTFRIDLTNVDALAEMMAGREAFAETEDAGRTAVNAGYPIRLLSLLFRPFFFDAGGALGLIVSFENLLFLILVLLIVFHLRTMTRLARNVPFVRYALVCSAGVAIVLAIGYYNVGLGIRQKATMILPQVLIAFVAMQAFLRARGQNFVVSGVATEHPRYA